MVTTRYRSNITIQRPVEWIGMHTPTQLSVCISTLGQIICDTPLSFTARTNTLYFFLPLFSYFAVGRYGFLVLTYIECGCFECRSNVAHVNAVI